MASRKVALVQRWLQEVWEKGREEVIAEIMAPGAVLHHQAQGATFRGPRGFLRLYRPLNVALEDIGCEIHQTIEQGDTIAVRWSFSGVPRRRPGAKGGRRKRMVLQVVTIIRVADGMFVEAWDTFDAAPLNAVLAAR